MDASVCLFGRGLEIRSAREDTRLAAWSDAPVLITGERGVGKTSVGHHIHQQSHRHRLPFVVVPCSHSESTVQCELISAFDRRAGVVFLDDVSELTPASQLLLLELMERDYAGVWCREPDTPRHLRVIASASERLSDLLEAGAFHEGLFYRLNVVHVSMPPLRDRREDIPGLIGRLLHDPWRSSRRRLTREAMARLVAHGWPGNVRELDQVLQDVSRRGAVIRWEDLPEHVLSSVRDDQGRSHAAAAICTSIVRTGMKGPRRSFASR
jgi:DNA-binding NtrC family response regulator